MRLHRDSGRTKERYDDKTTNAKRRYAIRRKMKPLEYGSRLWSPFSSFSLASMYPGTVTE